MQACGSGRVGYYTRGVGAPRIPVIVRECDDGDVARRRAAIRPDSVRLSGMPKTDADGL